MEGNIDRPRTTRSPWSTRKRLCVAAMAVVLAASIALVLIFNPLSLFYERHVSYDYRVVIESDASQQFAVVCPLPADHVGAVYPDVLSSMIVTGDVTISETTTPHGVGLKVVGTGSATIEWSHNLTYRTSTQSVYDHYSNLSMITVGYQGESDAFVLLEGVSVGLCLNYVYEHEHGDRYALGDKLSYGLAGNLTTGWNALSVGFLWLFMF